jgi:hypothetical protein
VGGLVVSGTVIPDWQWFDEVEHQVRAAFVVHTGGYIDDEHGGWAKLIEGVAESLKQARDEQQAAQEATERLSERYRRCLVQDDRADYIHLRGALVSAAGVSSQPVRGMHGLHDPVDNVVSALVPAHRHDERTPGLRRFPGEITRMTCAFARRA